MVRINRDKKGYPCSIQVGERGLESAMLYITFQRAVPYSKPTKGRDKLKDPGKT